MLEKLIQGKKPLHTRDIHLATYHHSGPEVIVHGVLKDVCGQKTYDITGTPKEPGTIHHLEVNLLINTESMTIKEAEARMVRVPMQECLITLDTVDRLKGLEIKSGFSRRVREIMGGNRGCGHLCNLIVVMAQEIVQGSLVYKRRNRNPLPRDVESLPDKEFLIDSCRMWTKDGPKIRALKEAIAKK